MRQRHYPAPEQWELSQKEKTRLRKLKRKFNLSEEEIIFVTQASGGVCAICKKRKPLSIDHDHASGRFRGLLCNNCNAGLGMFKDDVSLLAAAIVYLQPQSDLGNED